MNFPFVPVIRPLLPIAACAFLISCGGSSSDTPGPPIAVVPPPPPVTPTELPIVLLSENPGGAFYPGGIAVDATGTVYVGNQVSHKILKLSQNGTVTDFVGSGSTVPVDGTGSNAAFDGIDQLVFDARSQSLIAVSNVSSSVRRISQTGGVNTVTLPNYLSNSPIPPRIPSEVPSYASVAALGADGTLYAMTMFDRPSGGYTPNTGYTRYRFLSMRTVNADGTGRAVFAQETGSYDPGLNPTGPRATTYTFPSDLSGTDGVLGDKLRGLAVDSTGNRYIADTLRHAVIKVTPAGIATTFAGTPGSSGANDGSGRAARFKEPEQIVIDKGDNLYVLDRGNYTVRKITPLGLVSTPVGMAGVNATKVGDLPGSLAYPAALALDDSGRLYVTVHKGVVRIKLP